MHNFDRHLRELLLIELLRIEQLIQTKIAYTFSYHHGYDHRKYLSSSCFNVQGPQNAESTERLIQKIRDMIAYYQTRHKAIAFYLEKYGYVPLWVLCTVLTFGESNYFFYRMLYSEKQEIAGCFHMNTKDFESVLSLLCSFRNKCAHGERIYSYKKDIVFSRFIPIFSYHKKLNIITNEKGPKFGREDILALLIVLKFFMPPQRYILLNWTDLKLL